MKEKNVLCLLAEANGEYVSGEKISQMLGVSRAAIWKQIDGLRKSGYTIEAVKNRGYRLVHEPDLLTKDHILSCLGDHPWAGNLLFYDCIDSTNNRLKAMGDDGCDDGTVVIAGQQTAGRGRQGRAFISPEGLGVYFSVLLRPNLRPDRLSDVTARAAVAVCEAICQVSVVQPQIKWPNDIVINKHKVVGILTELSVEWETVSTQYLVIGIGINCNHQREDFPEELQETASSIRMESDEIVNRSALCAALIRSLEKMSREILSQDQSWRSYYKDHCITLGKQVQVIQGSRTRIGHALELDENLALRVEFEDGHIEAVNTGEVSIRGMYGYID